MMGLEAGRWGRSEEVHNHAQESEFALFAMYVTQTPNLLWQEGADNKYIQISN